MCPKEYTYKVMLTLLQEEKWSLEEVCRGRDELVTLKDKEIATTQRALLDTQEILKCLTEESASLKGKLEGNSEQIQSLEIDVLTLQVSVLSLSPC